ncbi:hypothetical protein [Brevundimonas sp. GCM10030266]|uniref:hypothetical protein n=1 Tax=Brevundimonas sp. GCM10030266 TaxID=3273386 RepID=UPI00360B6BE1
MTSSPATGARSGQRPHVVERALELARTGLYRARWDISRALEKEGYTIADVSHLDGPSMSRTLTTLCRQARRPKAAA